MTDTITLRRPDDWHVHLRDGDMLGRVAGATALQFARTIVMPNLAPPVTSVSAARAYRDRIMAALPRDTRFTPLMTAYLTDDSDPQEIARGAAEGVFTAAKLYPANATTNSAHGVTSIAAIRNVLEAMEAIGLPLLVHGEVTDADIDIFDREAVFIDRVLAPLLRDMPGLRIVFEHVTTADAVAFVESADADVAATITPHHLHINRNAMLVGGIRPHAYCLPVAKREAHRQALRKAATGTSDRFFLGTDSAPHERAAKESACGCAGIFNAPFAIESYAQVFDDEGALDRLEAFASLNGPAFYRLPPNEERITLKRGETIVPDLVDGIVPFHAGETLGWSLA
ncbi:dihydroorotase [Sphingorhabdus soli]|uniref:Dihydroorotase n=1 Tax=Flavisphingopyxis soli TaxID=2601267 RepID=A0A5C6UMV2_9SPHN|nr:dihydroorotase [Sphingorhabdus soli]TXC73864.1 dihydroorotase [Sphingorhabdus soli]